MCRDASLFVSVGSLSSVVAAVSGRGVWGYDGLLSLVLPTYYQIAYLLSRTLFSSKMPQGNEDNVQNVYSTWYRPFWERERYRCRSAGASWCFLPRRRLPTMILTALGAGMKMMRLQVLQTQPLRAISSYYDITG